MPRGGELIDPTVEDSFGNKVKEKYIKQFKTTPFKAYGAVMKGYILIPENMWNDMTKLSKLMNESNKYVMTLEPK